MIMKLVLSVLEESVDYVGGDKYLIVMATVNKHGVGRLLKLSGIPDPLSS